MLQQVFHVASVFMFLSVGWDGRSHAAHIRRRGCERDTKQAREAGATAGGARSAIERKRAVPVCEQTARAERGVRAMRAQGNEGGVGNGEACYREQAWAQDVRAPASRK